MRDIIRCGLAMIVCFLALAGIYALMGAPLLAAAQVIVYIGAISVLILFAIMLTQTKDAPTRLVFQTQAGPASIAAIDRETEVSYIRREQDWLERARLEGRIYDPGRLLPVLPPTLTGIAPGARTNGNGHGHDGHGAVAALGPGQHE